MFESLLIWIVANETCYPPMSFNRNDGDEPNYMAADPNQWLSSSLEACCKKWFSMSTYAYDKCVGKYPPDSDDCVRFLYYPDWQGNNEGCIDDGTSTTINSVCICLLSPYAHRYAIIPSNVTSSQDKSHPTC